MQLEFHGTFSPNDPSMETGTIFSKVARHTDQCEVKGYQITFSSSNPEEFALAVSTLRELATVSVFHSGRRD